MACHTSMRFRVTHVPCTLAVVLALILSALVALPCAVADEMPTEETSVVEAVVQEPASEELVLQEAVPEESVAPVDALVATEAQPIPAMHGRPSVNGQLMVRGTKLCDLAGRPVTLGGVSTHGLQWFPEFVSSELFGKLSTSWDTNVVRLAFYPEALVEGDVKNGEQEVETLYRGIEAAIENDQYVIIDWHILEEGDPNAYLEDAKKFFSGISGRYAGVPNVIYEICNEPNGETTWSDIRSYAEEIIPLIRNHSPEAVVIVGTPNYDRELLVASRNPVPFDNVLYTLHFYAATHGEDLRGELVSALEAGLPIFVSECGLSEASGDGRVDFDSAVAWFDLLREMDVSYCIWSFSNKGETSAMLAMHTTPETDLAPEDLSPVGRWVSELVQGTAPADIPQPAVDEEGYLVDEVPS